VLYGDGHYSRKDRKEKVCFNIGTAINVKAPVKPLNPVIECERLALGKPISDLSSNDGMALDKPNISISAQDGKTAGKTGVKVEKERTRLLEQQVKMERERREQMEREYAAELERREREFAAEKVRMTSALSKLEQEKQELMARAGENEDEDMEEDEPDVYVLDEDLIQAGPYYNVRAARSLMMEDEILLGDGRVGKRKEAGFNIMGEKRLEKVIWRHRLDVGMNITTSFNPANMKCSGCPVRGVHSVVGREDGKQVVIVASDQNFPPVLYSKDGEACVAIIRIEFGTAKELGFAVGDLLHGISLPAGSVILVGSTSDLGRQGIVGYTDELARSLRILKEKQGKKVQVVALPPVPLGRINSFTVLRLVVEAEHWAEKLEGGDGVLLKRTRGELVKTIGEHAAGHVKDPEVTVNTLLKKVDGYDRVRVRSVVWNNMPEKMRLLSVEGEARIINTLVEEVRTNFGVRVSRNLDLAREGGRVQPEYKYVIIGASNADRVGDIMKELGKDVLKITKGGWRPSKKGVEEMLALMAGKDLGGRIVIFYGLDNGVYFAEDEEGDRSQPKPDEKGVYHVKGRVELATERQAKGLLANCDPILDRVSENREMLVAPGVRHYREPCCVLETHCTNLTEGGYRRGMIEDLGRIRDAMGDLCREKGMRSYRVVSPVDQLGIRVAMSEDDLIKILGDDPVHMTAAAYMKLAGSLISLAESPRTIFSGEKREREESEEDDGVENYHRKRHEWLYEVVSGSGGWHSGQQAKGSGQDRGRDGGRGEKRFQSGGDKGQGKGRMGGNIFAQ
jgi:hypothetical protein